jgi:hypothetical protein
MKASLSETLKPCTFSHFVSFTVTSNLHYKNVLSENKRARVSDEIENIYALPKIEH